MFEDDELAKAREIVDSWIEISPDKSFRGPPVTFMQKLDRLSELIDALRFKAGYSEDLAGAQPFRPDSLFADPSSARIHFFRQGTQFGRSSRSLDPNRLTVPLLDFLYSHPARGKGVLAIIRQFVSQFMDHCSLKDFERTATGVLRIETNVRFAARELRKHGLLQFTQAEAFKTWRLSILGILAAEAVSDSSWSVPRENSLWHLQERVLDRLTSLNDLSLLLARLEAVAKMSTVSWSEKQTFMALTMKTLEEYGAMLRRAKAENWTKAALADKINLLLRRLNSAPEAAVVVAAFDETVVQTEIDPFLEG